jgi:hypothetical protein
MSIRITSETSVSAANTTAAYHHDTSETLQLLVVCVENREPHTGTSRDDATKNPQTRVNKTKGIISEPPLLGE